MKSLFSSRIAIEIFWLYFFILIPTLLFKYLYLDQSFHGGISVLADELGLKGYTLIIFGSDFFEVFIVAGLILLMARIFSENIRKYIIIPSVLACFIVAAANWISIQQVGTLATFNSLEISFSWIFDNPEVMSKYIARKRDVLFILMGLLGIVLWSLLAILVPKKIQTQCFLKKHHMLLVVVSSFIIFPVIFVSYFISVSNASSFPMQGYWSSTLTSYLVDEDVNFSEIDVPTKKELKESYQKLIYPDGVELDSGYIENILKAPFKKRHILVLSLETAAKKYYPIINNTDLPVLYRMGKQAIVSENHYANTPFTSWATFAMISGTYPSGFGVIAKIGDFETDGLATVLGRNGYESTFIDSYKIDWLKGMNFHKKTWRNLGFENLLDTINDSELIAMKKENTSQYKRTLRAEEKSIDKVISAILEAEKRDRKAVVFLDTILGHYEWKSPEKDESLQGKEKIFNIIKVFDAFLGNILDTLKKNNLDQDIIIVITGDHGLRYMDEFESLGETFGHLNMAFNVPFLLYAPGLINDQISLPYVTSHVDITPTLLEFVGVETSDLFHHGQNVLDKRLHHRVTFMMNTNLSPTDGFHWQGNFMTYNNLSGKSYLAKYRGKEEKQLIDKDGQLMNDIPYALKNPSEVLESANQHFNLAAAWSLRRAVDSSVQE